MDDSKIDELLRISKESNAILKQLLYGIAQSSNNQYIKDFIINFMANLAADKYQGNNKI